MIGSSICRSSRQEAFSERLTRSTTKSGGMWQTQVQERAVIRYAAEATQQVTVASATFEALRTFLDDRQLLELVLNVAFYNMIVRVLVPLEVELEPDAHENRYRLDARSQGHDR
jgi:alkylhydroperoxidase family enzyme